MVATFDLQPMKVLTKPVILLLHARLLLKRLLSTLGRCIYFLMCMEITGGWTIAGTPLDLNDPRLLAVADSERHLLEGEYDDYAATNTSGAAFCRSAALIVSPLDYQLCEVSNRLPNMFGFIL
ncbi:hypothetical protein CsSME_00043645 [Camellia sinensis var. sinensis]